MPPDSEPLDMSVHVANTEPLEAATQEAPASERSGHDVDRDIEHVSTDDDVAVTAREDELEQGTVVEGEEQRGLTPTAPRSAEFSRPIDENRVSASEGSENIPTGEEAVGDPNLDNNATNDEVDVGDADEAMEPVADDNGASHAEEEGLEHDEVEAIVLLGAEGHDLPLPDYQAAPEIEDVDMEMDNETPIAGTPCAVHKEVNDMAVATEQSSSPEMQMEGNVGEGDGQAEQITVNSTNEIIVPGNDAAHEVESPPTGDSPNEDIVMSIEDSVPERGSAGAGVAASDSDLMKLIPNMHRLLQLMLERGSGGLVNKLIIAQESLSQLINTLLPGAYQSLTKIDFTALDQVQIRLVGVYGSKSEIAKFLKSIDAISEEVYSLLLLPRDERAELTRPYLESGLYFLLGEASEGKPRDSFIIYWPEDTTWDDDALSSVSKNRVAFMRYLSKLVDQTLCLISPEHADTLVFNVQSSEQGDDKFTDVDMDDADRIFSFEVAKTKEDDENVSQFPGFEFTHASLRTYSSNFEDSSREESLSFAPRLIPGETACGFLLAAYEPAKPVDKPLNEHLTEMRLRTFLEDKRHKIELPNSIAGNVLDVLLSHGLKARYPKECSKFKEEMESSIRRKRAECNNRKKAAIDKLPELKPAIVAQLQSYLYGKAQQMYPSLGTALDEALAIQTTAAEIGPSSSHDNMHVNFDDHFPLDLKGGKAKATKSIKLEKIQSESYRKLKYRATLCCVLFEAHSDISEEDQAAITKQVFETGETPQLSEQQPGMVSSLWSYVMKAASLESDPEKEAKRKAEESDPVLLSKLDVIQARWPCLSEGLHSMVDEAVKWIQSTVDAAASDACKGVLEDRREALNKQFSREFSLAEEDCRGAAKKALLDDIRRAEEELTPDVKDHVVVDDCTWSAWHGRNPGLFLKGRWRTESDPAVTYTICPLTLTQSDEQALQMDIHHIPKPKYQTPQSQRFQLPLDHRIRHIQRIAGDRYLIIIDTGSQCLVFIENIQQLGAAISRRSTKRTLNYGTDRMASTFVFAFDETKRTLAFCWTDETKERKLWLQLYFCDELYATVASKGSSIPLSRWYERVPKMRAIVFMCGSEDLCFIDEDGQARLFSLVTEQFRPATLQLDTLSQTYVCSPDGACLLVVRQHEGRYILNAYHWASFGSNPRGLELELSLPKDVVLGITSFGSRPCVHLLALSSVENSITSALFVIQKRSSEFSFMEHERNMGPKDPVSHTVHNSLLDCHLDVWTRFPVQAAFTRETISPFARRQTSLVFVSPLHGSAYPPYFKSLVKTFERRTRKPTGGRLDDTVICSVDIEHLSLADLELSLFHIGEWIVELLCLIPLHLAVTYQNRFVPLKDGIWSYDLERSLLGADLEEIVDALSLGWYESIFQSYLVNKPVRVVSSMGEQSVGKSYCLNHFADTSFAGSAMRTTEGVWMSVTPTQGEVVVALDFEGVHSIERSAQEDALLVLFNAAISNLILFRNNFALSRDITGLFTSFHSSSSVFDPKDNPGLFNGRLCIIIKDVVESDAREIVKEFSLKFQKIVQEEQESNFISKLHRGRLQIVPWPVINSPGFYSLFARLKREMDKQDITHPSSGIFLQTIKMLMAKLKTNDWGSMDQNLAAHRARLLSNILRTAVTYGLAQVEPDAVELKSFDTDAVLTAQDSNCTFHIAGITTGTADNDWAQKEEAFRTLAGACMESLPSRFTSEVIGADGIQSYEADWIQSLQKLLTRLADARKQHVTNWVEVNTSRFSRDHPEIRNLFNDLDRVILDLQSSVQICGAHCNECDLLCVRPKQHPADHDCQTAHTCWRECELTEEHDSVVMCGLRAGHSGRHMCDTRAHSCGKECSLSDKRGCMGPCNLPIDHSGNEHTCSARTHFCNHVCDLQEVQASDGTVYSCDGYCTQPWDEHHERHTCEHSLSCPLQCRLCPRLCSTPEHLHGLNPSSVHLCGQQHACLELCALPGICHIETQPSEIVDQFHGTHESFQYTKYTQNAKRLSCAIPIPPGSLSHIGTHQHDFGDKMFHFCEERCSQCAYFCTLPLGHAQAHQTRHGSMAMTKWLLEEPDGTVDLDGHRFGRGDDGAPMLCNLVCAAQGRHVHVDFCRSSDGDECGGPEYQHISRPLAPLPSKRKDWVSHRLFWARLGFKDPYTRDEQAEFAKCDAMCPGDDHNGTAGAPSQPSYCTLPALHAPHPVNTPIASGAGYVSSDGHMYSCTNPALMHQAYHIIFVIDGSGSMWDTDRFPLRNTPAFDLISRHANNRYGAVLSALYGFWSARATALRSGARQDGYTVISFSDYAETILGNDFTSTPDELLNQLLTQRGNGGTNFNSALTAAQGVLESYWSQQRAPVVIFLSDGQCSLRDAVVYDLCRKAVSLGRALSFYAISFGTDTYSTSLRRMVQIAQEVFASAPRDPLLRPSRAADVCAYSNALDTIQLTETFMGIAESLRKTRASLLRAQ